MNAPVGSVESHEHTDGHTNPPGPDAESHDHKDGHTNPPGPEADSEKKSDHGHVNPPGPEPADDTTPARADVLAGTSDLGPILVGPDAKPLATAGTGEALLVADLAPTLAIPPKYLSQQLADYREIEP